MWYDAEECRWECDRLVRDFPETALYSIGESVAEQKLFCLEFGKGEKKLFLNGGHHGLEYLTSAFLMRFLRAYAEAARNGTRLFSYEPRFLAERVRIFLVPMVNPDGVDLAVEGIDPKNPYHRKLIGLVGIHDFCNVWQANLHGVDLNHNYRADWQVAEKSPAPSRYSGPYAESEPETKAIVRFVRTLKPDILMAFHSQGGEIYDDFREFRPEGTARLAEKMAEVSGYRRAEPEESASFGGCKDWFIREFEKPGYTIEVGHGKNPLQKEVLENVFQEAAPIILCALKELSGT